MWVEMRQIATARSLYKYIAVSGQTSLHAKLTTSVKIGAVPYSTESFSAAQRLEHRGFDFNREVALVSLSSMDPESGTVMLLMLFLLLSLHIKMKCFSSEISIRL